MRNAMAIVLALVVAISAFADERYEQYGEWTVHESEGTLLDDPSRMAVVFGHAETALAIRMHPTLRVAVIFSDYLATPNESHDQAVVFVTDQSDAEMLEDRGFRVDVDMIIWDGKQAQRIIDQILRAGGAMFRTYDYNGQMVDAMFSYDSENAIAAWEAVK